MPKFIANIPKVVVALLLVAAIVNLLIGVFLRYVMIEVTDWLDVDPVRFTWVEEVGEMMLAWLTLSRRGDRRARALALHPACAAQFSSPDAGPDRARPSRADRRSSAPSRAWYGVKLCLLNRTLVDAGPRDQPRRCSAPPSWSAASCWSSTPSPLIVAPPPIDPDAVH